MKMGELPSSYESHRGSCNNHDIVDSKTLAMASKVFITAAYSSFHPYFTSTDGAVHVTKSSSNRSSKSWWNDPETKRKKRIVRYKIYGAEGKIKASLKKGIGWIKKKCSTIRNRF